MLKNVETEVIAKLESKLNATVKTQLKLQNAKLKSHASRITNFEALNSGLQTQYDTVKTALQTQFNTENQALQTQFNTEKQGLRTQFDTQKESLRTQFDTQKESLQTTPASPHGDPADPPSRPRQGPQQETCPHLDKSIKFRNKKTLTQMQDEFCTEYNLDLANSNVVNMAMIFLDKDIGRDDAFKRALASTAKFRVTDKCTSPLFKGNDVSLQHLNGEWVMIAQLDKESPYLKHEINDECASRNYLPRTEVGLQMYTDKNQCCKDTKDYFECLKSGCSLTELNHHWVDQPLSYKMTLTGNVFEFESWDY
jgi:hypothetical protein